MPIRAQIAESIGRLDDGDIGRLNDVASGFVMDLAD
jgi:hypothetical protein